MRVNDLYSFDNSNISSTLKVDDALGSAGVNTGDILEGIVTGVDKKTHVTFEQLNKREITFENSAVKNAYVGEKRRFEVVSANADKLVLRDLGGVGAEVEARAMMAAQVDFGMPKMVNDFEETMGTKEEEDTDSIRNLSDDDYSELAAEGFSIEDYKAERLVRAIERIKGNRQARRESIERQGEELKNERDSMVRRARKAAADKYAAHAGIIDALADADLPLTDGNIEGIIGAIGMSGEATRMTVNSYAYLIGRELEPTVSNVYRSVYSGSIRRTEITPTDWAALRPAADEIVNEANDRIGSPAVSIRDARWLVEYDIPITADNLIYKNELERLTDTGCTPEEIAFAAARAMQRGGNAEDAVMIASHEDKLYTDPAGRKQHRWEEPIEGLLGRLNLEQKRLAMATAGGTSAKVAGLATDADGIRTVIDELKVQIRYYYEQLAKELEVDDYAEEDISPIDLAVQTSLAADEIGNAPVTLYGITFTARAEITLGKLADEAANLNAGRAVGSYEASATRIRSDLGDSIDKAFGNIDKLLADINMEATEANVRAVKILGHNSMEITAENVENIKYYDTKVTAMVEALKPAVVMAMIKRGYNPLEQDIDTINSEIAEIEAEEGVSAAERFSTFLVRLEEHGEITEGIRDAYIGIYRLLYQIERSDGAAIGAAINSGRSLTLVNLLTESRTLRSNGLDENLGDDTGVVSRSYTNSITDQIRAAFTQVQQERFNYNLKLAEDAAKVTSPEAWHEAVGDTIPNITLEQLAERLERADAQISDATVTAAAENVRNVMASGGSAKKFLKSIGVDDSVRNIDLLESEGEDLTLAFDTGEQLVDAMGSGEQLRETFETAQNRAARQLDTALVFEPGVMARAAELMSAADRYGLLKAMAQRQHFRMSIGEDGSARITLTIVRNDEKAGGISLEVSTAKYRVRGELYVTSGTQSASGEAESGGIQFLSGRITCDSASELQDMKVSAEAFGKAAKAIGFDTEGLTSGVDRLSPNMYLERLGELKQRADSPETEQRGRTSTARLYSVARLFVETFIGD